MKTGSRRRKPIHKYIYDDLLSFFENAQNFRKLKKV